jgi:hypothetical protein
MISYLESFRVMSGVVLPVYYESCFSINTCTSEMSSGAKIATNMYWQLAKMKMKAIMALIQTL